MKALTLAVAAVGAALFWTLAARRPAAAGQTHAPEASAPAAASAPTPGQRRLFPPQDLGLLESPDREQWNKPDLIMDELLISDGATVADLGAGGGWFTIRLSKRVGPNGRVFATDVQRDMIEAISRRVQRENLSNVVPVLGTTTDPKLPAGRLDAALIVDAYHEMDDPAQPNAIVTLLGHVARALKPEGRLGIVGYLPGGGGPGPDPSDREDPEQIVATVRTAGLRLIERETIPPFMFLLVFGKDPAAF
jgi:ubiquinone/menaquinone biosynthesis C-methylase UbiE